MNGASHETPNSKDEQDEYVISAYGACRKIFKLGRYLTEFTVHKHARLLLRLLNSLSGISQARKVNQIVLCNETKMRYRANSATSDSKSQRKPLVEARSARRNNCCFRHNL